MPKKNKSTKIIKEDDSDKMSKMALDTKNLKSETIPNPVVLNGIEAIGLKRINPIEIPRFLLLHPALGRAIEIKANRMIELVDEDLLTNVVQNSSDHKFAKEASEYCKNILDNSGGPIFLKQKTQEAYRFGTSFAVLQPNVLETEILRFENQHPIFFGPARYPGKLKGPGIDWGGIPMINRTTLVGKMMIDPKTKKIAKYSQYTFKYGAGKSGQVGSGYGSNFSYGGFQYVNTRNHPGLKTRSAGPLAPFGSLLDSDLVIQLFFDNIGDEPLGIPLIQTLQSTITHLIRIEQAGAQTMVNFGFNKYIATTPFKDEKKMKAFAKTLANIQKDSVIVLPEGIELDNKVPGSTEFASTHNIFLRLIAIRTGIPVPLLLQDGTSTNKSTIQEQRKDMYADFRADELIIERVINEGFFKACQYKWKDLSVKELNKVVPKFRFNEVDEDKDITAKRTMGDSLSVKNYSSAIKDLGKMGVKPDSPVIKSMLLKIQEITLASFPEDVRNKMIDTNAKIDPPEDKKDPPEEKKAS